MDSLRIRFSAGSELPLKLSIAIKIHLLPTAPASPQNFVDILDEHGVRKVCSQDFIERFGPAYVNELREFVNCIREQRPPGVAVTDGVEATRIALAATRSFREKTLLAL